MGLWQDDCLIARIVTKAILRGGFSFGADGLLTAMTYPPKITLFGYLWAVSLLVVTLVDCNAIDLISLQYKLS